MSKRRHDQQSHILTVRPFPSHHKGYPVIIVQIPAGVLGCGALASKAGDFEGGEVEGAVEVSVGFERVGREVGLAWERLVPGAFQLRLYRVEGTAHPLFGIRLGGRIAYDFPPLTRSSLSVQSTGLHGLFVSQRLVLRRKVTTDFEPPNRSSLLAMLFSSISFVIRLHGFHLDLQTQSVPGHAGVSGVTS